jgi:hypothetical protein
MQMQPAIDAAIPAVYETVPKIFTELPNRFYLYRDSAEPTVPAKLVQLVTVTLDDVEGRYFSHIDSWVDGNIVTALIPFDTIPTTVELIEATYSPIENPANQRPDGFYIMVDLLSGEPAFTYLTTVELAEVPTQLYTSWASDGSVALAIPNENIAFYPQSLKADKPYWYIQNA